MIQQTARDVANAEAVRLELEDAWDCRIYPFPPMTPVDFYVERAGALEAVLELKCRKVPVDAYPTTFLTVRKWLALTMTEAALDRPALFVVRWTDALRWIDVRAIDARDVVIVGDRGVVEHGRNLEPTIRVPVDGMVRVR